MINEKEIQQKKKFYLYNFIIVFIQYSFIITITINGFEFKLNYGFLVFIRFN